MLNPTIFRASSVRPSMEFMVNALDVERKKRQDRRNGGDKERIDLSLSWGVMDADSTMMWIPKILFALVKG